MKINHSLLIPVIAALLFVPAVAQATALSDLTAATATNNINNGNNGQTWTWNTLTQGPALTLNSSANTAAMDSQIILDVGSTGTNSNANVQTAGIYVLD